VLAGNPSPRLGGGHARGPLRPAVQVVAAMSDVPFSNNELACLICQWMGQHLRGLRWHRQAQHGVILSTLSLRLRLKRPVSGGGTSSCTSGRASGETLTSVPSGGDSPPPPSPPPPPPPPLPPPPQPPPACADNEDPEDDGVGIKMDAAIASAVAASRVPVEGVPSETAAPVANRSRKRKSAASPAPSGPIEYKYASVSAHARGFFEDLRDNKRSEPLVRLRKAARVGMFNSPKLLDLQRFVLDATLGGLQVAAQEKLYTLISSIEADAATGVSTPVNETFPTFKSFKQAILDDLDAAVLAEGWRKATVTEEGETYNAYFRPVLDVVMALLDGRRVVKLWSGDEGPAPPSDRRETPMDGDAFRSCEALVFDRLGKSCVLGLHVFSDSTHISWSGGMTSGLLGRPSEKGRGCCLGGAWESAGWWFRSRVPDANLALPSSRRVFAFRARFLFPPAGSTQTLSRSSTPRQHRGGRCGVVYSRVHPDRSNSEGGERGKARQAAAVWRFAAGPIHGFSHGNPSQSRRRAD